MPSEVEHLRRELRDVRYVTEAILMFLVGKEKTPMWELEARVQSSLRRKKTGTPLREVGIKGETHDRLSSSWNGPDIETVEELVRRFPRHEVAAMEGIGRKTLEKIDAVIAGRGLYACCDSVRRKPSLMPRPGLPPSGSPQRRESASFEHSGGRIGYSRCGLPSESPSTPRRGRGPTR